MFLAVILSVTPAVAQERSPALRQSLVDMAYVLGEAHALRQACNGPRDQYWRSRMQRMVETEQPDLAFDRRLRESFNTGFVTRQGGFPDCTPATARALSGVLAKGQVLAARLARARAEPSPSEIAEPPPTR